VFAELHPDAMADHRQYVVRPPDRSNTEAVVKEFSLLTSQATMLASSSTSRKRPRGMRLSMYSMKSLGTSLRIGVLAAAGVMALTAMSYLATSLPSDFTMPITPAFEAA